MTFDMNDAEPQKTGEPDPRRHLRQGDDDPPPRRHRRRERDRPRAPEALRHPGQRRADARLPSSPSPRARTSGGSSGRPSPSPAASSTRTASRSARSITKSTLRAMIDSALGLDPEDMSEATKAKRILRGFADLSGITFVAKIKVEASDNPAYPRQEPARPCRAADRARVAARSWTASRCRRGRARGGSRRPRRRGRGSAGVGTAGEGRASAARRHGARAPPPASRPRRRSPRPPAAPAWLNS